MVVKSDKKMKTFDIAKDVEMDIMVTDEVPICIEAAGNFINITFEELEKMYTIAKPFFK